MTTLRHRNIGQNQIAPAERRVASQFEQERREWALLLTIYVVMLLALLICTAWADAIDAFDLAQWVGPR